MLEKLTASPTIRTRSPHLETVMAKRKRIQALRKQGRTWPEILTIIFEDNPPTLRTFKRLWAQVAAN